jgi:chaperonin GroES
MNLKPYGDRVIVKPTKKENATEDGIEFASAVAQEITNGEVTAGNDTLPAGTKIIFSKYAGEEVTIDDEVYKIINLSEVLAYE